MLEASPVRLVPALPQLPMDISRAYCVLKLQSKGWAGFSIQQADSLCHWFLQWGFSAHCLRSLTDLLQWFKHRDFLSEFSSQLLTVFPSLDKVNSTYSHYFNMPEYYS